MIVILHNGIADLLLTDVKYDSEGSVKSGYVENGCWHYEVRGGEELAKDGNRIVNRWPLRENLKIVDIPMGVTGDYNSIMQWAEENQQ